MLFVEFGEFVEETVEETHQFFQSTRLSEGARVGVVFLCFLFSDLGVEESECSVV